MNWLPAIPVGSSATWVAEHLGDLAGDAAPASDIAGGQEAADAALSRFDVRGYAADRGEVWPAHSRGASQLSPYIRHGLLSLARVWEHVGDGPPRDVARFRDELLWQEYARHLYSRLGARTRHSLRYRVDEHDAAPADPQQVWAGSDARCLQDAWQELQMRGWLPNQSRMWLASHWGVRGGHGWQDGEDVFFRHLLDGSRAANRLGWQWTVGAQTGKAYGFSQWQVRKRAPGLCDECSLVGACPIADWPTVSERASGDDLDPRLRADPQPLDTAGPPVPVVNGSPDLVWITAESLGDEDPALAAHPGLPVAFVFEEPLLRRLRLSAKRLVFLAECLADLSTRRELRIGRGHPPSLLAGQALAGTFTPVPGWRRHARAMHMAATHPWPWLRRPGAGSASSYSAWLRGLPTGG